MAIFRRRSQISIRSLQIHLTKWKSTSSQNVLEIGSVEPEILGRYKAGQCFLHRTFAYRGVVLCGWKAQIMDRDDKDSPKINTYYQVLIDERDNDHIRVQTDVGNLLEQLRKQNPKNFRFTGTGFDQVSHNDIIPYKPTNDNPIHHSLFEGYFVVRQVKGLSDRVIVPKVALQEWKKKHLPWLYYTQVHKLTTSGVRVTAMSLYMGKKRVAHWWRYCIRIENLSQESISFKSQRWGIYTGSGELHTLRSMGILGTLPNLPLEARAVQYCSHITLRSPRGHMWGYFLVQKSKTQDSFLCPVPSFALESTLLSKK